MADEVSNAVPDEGIVKKSKKEAEVKHNEAPASATVKIKSPKGFVYMWTMRDDHSSNLMFKVAEMEKKWIQFGWSPVEEQARGSYPKKEVEYIPNRKCPKCGSPLVMSQTKTGKKLIKCSTNKWNKMANRAEGCDFVEWQEDYQNQ